MTKWVKVAKVQELEPGSGRTVDAEGTKLALFNVGGGFEAVADACAHRGGSLGEGALEGACVVCPWHHWAYDMKTGNSTTHPGRSVKKFPTKVEGEYVLVEL